MWFVGLWANHTTCCMVSGSMNKLHTLLSIMQCIFLTEMVHSCVVLGCKNRSNKEECKGIKFYTLPFKNEELLKTWLALICRRHNEVTIHSRVCSAHFVGGIKTKYDQLPQIFPWQKSTSVSLPTACTNPSEIINHDHCYCSDFKSPSVTLYPRSSF